MAWTDKGNGTWEKTVEKKIEYGQATLYHMRAEMVLRQALLAKLAGVELEAFDATYLHEIADALARGESIATQKAAIDSQVADIHMVEKPVEHGKEEVVL